MDCMCIYHIEFWMSAERSFTWEGLPSNFLQNVCNSRYLLLQSIQIMLTAIGGLVISFCLRAAQPACTPPHSSAERDGGL
ncbi:hypothetical protein M8C21_031426 [Ambrosia artemisiifolia]|uniref:Uncharacterized protein n=1 Tax=Ambrosia artemisiifolia TaxID=4212 RepID=A0AAD5CWJ1_AMBAR|nr:hypothetical protein M8C21_031426 [Ambrosia artemisiifolia]